MKDVFMIPVTNVVLDNFGKKEVVIPNEFLPADTTDPVDIINHLVKIAQNYKLQRNWINAYMVSNCETIPCPYQMGYFDQTKRCPYWRSYSGNKPEDESLEAWKKLVFSGEDDDLIDCSRGFYTCMKRAAEYVCHDRY